MFYIRKKGSNNFWHVYNNGAKNVSISDFEVVLDDVANTFAIILRNGANIPQTILNVTDIIVVDETSGSVEETFTNVTDLRNRLVVLGYTAYLGAGNADSITGLVEAGTNVTIIGNGTLAKPYVISSSGGSGSIPTLQQVTDENPEIINDAGDMKIVLDKELNGMFLYRLVGSAWENIGYYNTQGFSVGGFDDYANINVNFYTGELTISQGTDIIQFYPNSATKNGIEFATEDFALKRDGSNANSDIDINGYSFKANKIIVGEPTKNVTIEKGAVDSERTQLLQDKDGTFAYMDDIYTKADLVGGVVPSAQLPSFVDDVLEYANLASFPSTGESSKIYLAIDTNKSYRWSGSTYVHLDDSIALGETSSTAYRGDRGKNAYDHSQDVSTNPHNVTKSQVGLGNVDNTSDVNKPVSTAQATAIALKQDILGFTPDKPLSIMSLNSDYTGTSSTSLQKAFNVGSSGNGSFQALANKKYKLILFINLEGMSSTSGTMSYGLLGTATIDFISGCCNAKKSGTPSSPASGFTTLINSTNQVVVISSNSQNGYLCIEAVFTTTTSGTIIPSFSVSQSTTPLVKKCSFCSIQELGANTFTATSDIV